MSDREKVGTGFAAGFLVGALLALASCSPPPEPPPDDYILACER